MSNRPLNAWITCSLTEYLRDHGEQFGLFLPAKTYKVQITRCITEETTDKPDQAIWIDVSDGLHEIPVKLSREAKGRFDKQMSMSMRSMVRFKNESLRGAIFTLEDIRPNLTKVPLGDGRVGLTHEDGIVFVVNKLSLINLPESKDGEVHIMQPSKGLRHVQWKAFQGTPRAETAANPSSKSNAGTAAPIAVPEPEPVLPRKEKKQQEASVEMLPPRYHMLYGQVHFPLNWDSPESADEGTDFVESEEEPVSKEDGEMEVADDIDTGIEFNEHPSSSAYSWSVTPSPSKQRDAPIATSPTSTSPTQLEDESETDDETSADDPLVTLSTGFGKEKDTPAMSIISLPPSSRSSMVQDLSNPSEDEEDEVFHTAENTQNPQNTGSTIPEHILLAPSTSPDDHHLDLHSHSRSKSIDLMDRSPSVSSNENGDYGKRIQEPWIAAGRIKASDHDKGNNSDSIHSSDDDDKIVLLPIQDAGWRPSKSSKPMPESTSSSSKPRSLLATSTKLSYRSKASTEGRSSIIASSQPSVQHQQRPPLVDLAKWKAKTQNSIGKQTSRPPLAP